MSNQYRMRDWDSFGPYGGAQFPGYGCRGYGSYYNPDLFYNFYTPPTQCGGMTAGMYTAPHNVPAPAVQTYFTYQPFLPHEFMYTHHRKYTRWHSQGMGKTTTNIHWHTSDRRRLFDRGLVKFNFNGGHGGHFTNGDLHSAGADCGYGCEGGCADGNCHGGPQQFNSDHRQFNSLGRASTQSTRR